MDYNMLESFKDINEPVKDIIIEEEKNQISLIKIKYNSFELNIIPIAECCSHSWIQEDNYFDELIGKVIHSIIEDNSKVIELEDDNIYDVVKNHLFIIKFKDTDDIFKFYLRNDSNGYYDGDLFINMIKND